MVSMKQKEINKRRMDLLNETIEKPVTEAVRNVARKYNCSEDIMWNDRATQEEWLSEVFEINAALGKKCVAGMLRVIQEGWKMYRTGDNSNARVGALRVAKEGYSELSDLLYKLGLFTGNSAVVNEIKIMWNIDDYINKDKQHE